MALLRSNATITLAYNSRPVGAPGLRANISTPKPEQIDAAGGRIRYTVMIDPGPIVPENALMTVVTYPGNPSLVGQVLSCSEVIYDGEIPRLAITKFRAAVRVQP